MHAKIEKELLDWQSTDTFRPQLHACKAGLLDSGVRGKPSISKQSPVQIEDYAVLPVFVGEVFLMVDVGAHTPGGTPSLRLHWKVAFRAQDRIRFRNIHLADQQIDIAATTQRGVSKGLDGQRGTFQNAELNLLLLEKPYQADKLGNALKADVRVFNRASAEGWSRDPAAQHPAAEASRFRETREAT